MLPVDVLTVLGPGQEVLSPVLASLERQGSVEVRHHLIRGPAPLPGEDRAAAIARARNRAKSVGSARYVLFLDSDVVLPDGGLEALLLGLWPRPHHAALAIDYQGRPEPPGIGHVAMGCTLFDREVLSLIRFRTRPGRCECSCCCEDLRRLGYGIDYLPGLQAQHLRR